MSRPTIYINIAKPCHENWNNMDPVERGAFCHSCQKAVVDFSTMTDAQLIMHLTHEKLSCGRFRKDQVDRAIIPSHVENGFMRWRTLLFGLLPLFAFKQGAASVPARTPMDQNPISKKTAPDTIVKKLPGSILICGTVIDENGESVYGASIEVRKSGQGFGGNGAVSDTSGRFEIRLDQREFADGMPYLRVSNDHYSNDHYLTEDSIQNVMIRLRDQRMYMMGGMSLQYSTTYYEIKKPETLVKRLTRVQKEKGATPAGNLCIYGDVSSYDGPLRNTSIRVLDSAGVFYGNGSVTDSDGSFSIYIDEVEHQQKIFYLEVSHDGYYPRKISLDDAHLQLQDIRLYPIGRYHSEGNTTYKKFTPLQWSLFKTQYWFKKKFKKR